MFGEWANCPHGWAGRRREVEDDIAKGQTRYTAQYGPLKAVSDEVEVVARALVLRRCDPIEAATGNTWVDAYADAEVAVEALASLSGLRSERIAVVKEGLAACRDLTRERSR
jgi:hypothetical protein